MESVRKLGGRPLKTAGGKRQNNNEQPTNVQNLNQPSSNTAQYPNGPKGKMDTDHDELNQNLLCESINEEFLKPAIKGARSNEKFRSPVGESKLNSPGT